MPFFLPSRLISFEYFDNADDDLEYTEIARPYQREIDLAFFVANFGFSKADYEDLTPREKAFIYKAWESKIVSETQHINNAVMNAISNCNRKKGRKIKPLWRKKSRPVDKEIMQDSIAKVEEAEKVNGKGWVEKIYRANGRIRELKALRKRKEAKHG